MLVEICGDDGQVIGNHAPTDPAFETGHIVIETAPQAPHAPQLTDPTFNTGPETSRCAKPRLSFVPPAPRRLMAWLGQTHAFDAQLAGLVFVVRRMQSA